MVKRWIALLFMLLASGPFMAAGGAPDPIPTQPLRVFYVRSTGIFYADPGPANPTGIDGVSVAIFDPIHTAIRVNASAGAAAQFSPSNADQVFSTIFDSANTAVRVNCVVGCTAGVTNPAANGAVYTNASGALFSTATGGAGTLCFVSTNGGTPAWGACSGSAATAWSSLTSSTANLAVSVGNFTTTWTAGAATGATNPFSIIDTTGNTGTAALFNVNTVGTSTALPVQFTAKGTANGVQMTNAGLLQAIGTGGINATQLGGSAVLSSATAGMVITNNGSVGAWNPFPAYFVDSLSGADEGAKINACLALLPAGSGSCRTGAGTYAFSTAISLTKTARIEGAGAATDTSGGGSSSTILQWTGITGVPITLGTGSGGSQLVNFELSDTVGASLAEFVDIESGLDRLNGFVIQNPPKAATTAGIVVGVSGLVSTTTLNNVTIDGAGPWQIEPQNTNLFKITGDSHIIGRGAQGGLLLGTSTTDALGTMIGTGVEINSKVGGQDNIQIVRANGLHVEHGTWFEFGNNATTQGYAIDCPATAVKCENIDVAGAEFLGQSLGANNTAANFSGLSSATWTFEGNHVSGPFANPGYLINNTASAQITVVGNVLNFTGAAIAASLTNVVRAGNSYANVLGDLVPNYTGTITATHCANWTSSGVLGDAGAACGSGGGPGGLSTQYQINNAGALAGAAALTNSAATGVGTVIVSQAGTGGTDIPAERIIGFATSPTSDKWQVAATGQTPGNTCTIITCSVWVNASGNLAFAGNNATYGATGQSTQSFLRTIGATLNNNFAPPYFEGDKEDASVKSFFAPSTSQGGQFCGTSAVPVADCLAGTVFLQNPMTAAGDLIVGGTLVGQIAAPAAPVPTTATTGGSIPASTVVDVVITYFNGNETTASGQGTTTTGAGTTNTVTVPTPPNSGNAYDFKIYACTGASCTNYQLQGSVNALGANVTLTSIATGGAAPPTSNTTAMYSTPTRLALGGNGQVLTSNGTTVVWGAGGVADATFTVGTTAITANTCTAASTVTMTGVTTTMAFSISPNADVSGVTGWGSTGGLVIDAWPTANTLNFKVCNQTASSITPSGSVTFNVSAR